MTAKDLLKRQMEDSGFQLEKSLEGLADGSAEQKACGQSMSAREMVVHLCEVYTAVLASMRGEKHEWGTYTLADSSWPNALAEMNRLRTEAVQAILAGDDEKAISAGSAYIVAHDYYHVGQLALCRMESADGWDPYSIYR
jgi:uncharacterized damage-inducible protein DinB